jgi:hypothetical protein
MAAQRRSAPSPVSVERTVYAADGSRGGSRFGNDIAVNFFAAQHVRHKQALRHRLDFRNGAEVFKKCVALFPRFQRQYGIEQKIRTRVLDLRIRSHQRSPPSDLFDILA